MTDVLDRLVQAAVLKPGDRVIFRFDQRLSQQQAQDIKDQISAALGNDFPFLVIGEGVTTDVYTTSDD